jgi:hypothetical protein
MATRTGSTAAGRPEARKTSVAAGANANTDIAVPGIKIGRDRLESVLMFTAGVPSDVTSQASVKADGQIQLTGSSAGNVLVVFWTKVS